MATKQAFAHIEGRSIKTIREDNPWPGGDKLTIELDSGEIITVIGTTGMEQGGHPYASITVTVFDENGDKY